MENHKPIQKEKQNEFINGNIFGRLMSRSIYLSAMRKFIKYGDEPVLAWVAITKRNNLNEYFFRRKMANEKKKPLMEFKSICHFYMTTISFIIFKWKSTVFFFFFL